MNNTKQLEDVKIEQNKTDLGIDQNLEGALCYLLIFVTGILFLIFEKNSKFVKFHAMQSIALFFPLFIISIVLIPSLTSMGFTINFILGLVRSIIWIIEVILWILLMLKASQGEMYKLPIVGDFAEKQIYFK